MSVIYLGLDVHCNSFSAVCFNPESNTYSLPTSFAPTSCNMANYIRRVRSFFPNADLKVGYEAGCLGFVPFHILQDLGVSCDVMAPSSIFAPKHKVKTDKVDAKLIARTLAYGSYKPIYIPTVKEEEIRHFLHMREDFVGEFKRIKQRILSFCALHGLTFTGTKTRWTQKHISWLKALCLTPVNQITIDEYLESFFHLKDKIERIDAQMEIFAQLPEFAQSVQLLCCLKGIRTCQAMTIITELGDLHRFPSSRAIYSYVGLTPSEHSSGGSINKGAITKAGNYRVRRALIEAAQKYGSGTMGYKSKTLKARQKVQSTAVIGFADRVTRKLMQAWKDMERKGKNSNVIKCAIGRKLLGSIWALLTGRIEPRAGEKIQD